MILLAIDPGPEISGLIALEDGKLVRAGEESFDTVSWEITDYLAGSIKCILCEDVTPQKVAGTSLYDTAKVIGKIELLAEQAGIPCHVIPRRDVIRALCLNKSNDALVRAELESRGWTKGTKKNPGRAYGVSGHCWQALALAVAWMEMQKVNLTTKEKP